MQVPVIPERNSASNFESMQVVHLDSGHEMLSCVELADHFAEESWGALMRRNTSKFSSVFLFLGIAEMLDSPVFKNNHSDLGNLSYTSLCISLGLLYVAGAHLLE